MRVCGLDEGRRSHHIASMSSRRLFVAIRPPEHVAEALLDTASRRNNFHILHPTGSLEVATTHSHAKPAT